MTPDPGDVDPHRWCPGCRRYTQQVYVVIRHGLASVSSWVCRAKRCKALRGEG